ncbi:MAG: glycosyltransferase family 39 protein [Thainema sp.]
MKPQVKQHYWVLVGILILGTCLRFWGLTSQPLWLDEILTSLFSLGLGSADAPVNQFIPFADLPQIFALRPTSCAQIAAAVSTESTHPPLFFCLMHGWLRLLRPDLAGLAWAVRSLPALFGISAIAVMYGLGRLAFSPKIGLLAAAFMAVSPFAVYLSQEARHYTLPMLLITLSLMALVQMQQDLQKRQIQQPWVWLAWIVVNGIGLYVHYFYLLVVAAQVGVLLVWLVGLRARLRHWFAVAGSTVGVGLIFLPWIPTLLENMGRSEDDWLALVDPSVGQLIAPIFQMLAGWVITVIMLPVERRPLWITIPCGAIMLAFVIWLSRYIIRGFRDLWRQPAHRAAWLTIALYVGIVLLEFAVIIYGLGKDLTLAPRYNFVFYPGLCLLLATCLGFCDRPQFKPAWLPRTVSIPQFSVILAGLISWIFLINGLIFHRPFLPHEVARDMLFAPQEPVAIAVGYRSLQELALGFSFALEVDQTLGQIPETERSSVPPNLIFIHGYPQFDPVWQQLGGQLQPLNLSIPESESLNLWVVGTRAIRKVDYRDQFWLVTENPATETLTNAMCRIDRTHYGRIGYPYQAYRCQSVVR